MTPQEASIRSRELCLLAPVIPVLVVDDASKAADLARALVKGGKIHPRYRIMVPEEFVRKERGHGA